MGNDFFKPDTVFVAGSSVLQRLGLLLWWSGNATAALFTVGAVIALFVQDRDAVALSGLLVGVGALIWLVGRAALFLFASR